jgi:choline dehydrogenase
MEGVFTIPTAMDNGRRNGTREYIYETIEQGYPLELRTRSLVTNVVFADEPAPDGTPRAIGVEYMDGRHYRADRRAAGGEMPEKHRVTVSREVILAAGAFNTPQLLMLSGIGPREELDRHGVPVRVDLPGVGRNLQDRYEVGVVTEVEEDFRLLRGCSFDVNNFDPCMQEWHEGGGPYATNGGVVAMVHRSSVAAGDPDLFIFGVGGFFKGYYPGYSRDVASNKRLFTWVILKAHTRNRAGSVTLRSTDPRDTPRIDFAYFEDGGPEDLEAMVQGVEVVREVIDESNDLLLFDSVTELWPGPEADTRDDIAQWVRDEAWGHHASCTAPIGADGDPMAVLDSRFRVRGTTGLRVVDASVFPEIPGFFPVVPVYMVSEKAADVILADIGEPRDLRWESAPSVAIPDANDDGVTDTIDVPPDAGPVSGFSVTVHATHSWRSDLVVTLEHDGVEAVLLDREGYDADDVHQTFQVDDFDGTDAAGTWRLRVRDRASADTGTLDSWSIQLGDLR